ncbi:sensor histidine kinase [Romboutsia sp.]|uniref:sensor histidine kinase n=1 Tax=Romboutsia sp. TaxID=1965302 RepID=UPI003F369983
MKNKPKYLLNVYKYIFMQGVYLIISFLISVFILISTYNVLQDLYSARIYRDILDVILNIKYYVFGDSIYYLIAIILTVCIYLIISYKSNSKVATLMESVEIMANGDLDQRIDIDSKDDVGKVANNINIIIERLENITVEERKAQQTKSDLITNVSHDLRTPLTSIIGYLNLIEEDKYKDEVQLRYYTNIAYEKSKNLNVLINDLFELTKLQNKTLPLNKMEIDLVELISQVVSHLEYNISKENMEVRINFSEDKLIVNADPDKLVRVFDNLISNAFKYGSEGKYIDIVTSKIDNMANVKVINYGESIPQCDIPYIFDRFYRVEKSRNRNDGGSGLGLAITKNIIEVHDGNILVNSNNKMTIFEINLPISSLN